MASPALYTGQRPGPDQRDLRGEIRRLVDQAVANRATGSTPARRSTGATLAPREQDAGRRLLADLDRWGGDVAASIHQAMTTARLGALAHEIRTRTRALRAMTSDEEINRRVLVALAAELIRRGAID
jgi:hypothetical protein